MSKIYLTSSKPARMADVRIRIERDCAAPAPEEMFTLVFLATPASCEVPADAICAFDLRFDRTRHYFYTTDARASKILGAGYGLECLRQAMEDEKRLWLDWAEGRTYWIETECWSDAERGWLRKDTLGTFYGTSEAARAAEEAMADGRDCGLPGADLVCCDDELAAEFGAE